LMLFGDQYSCRACSGFAVAVLVMLGALKYAFAAATCIGQRLRR
jgi:hypothetical protein